MHGTLNRRLLALPLSAALLLGVAVAWQVANPTGASAEVTETASVSAGPNTFSQAAPTGNPSQYGTPLERCGTGVSYPLSGTNPILNEPLTTAFTSNVPLSVKVVFDGNQWYGLNKLVFTNRSAQPINVNCATIIFRAPSGSDQHYYLNDDPTGHPQSDYLEVPRGDGTSHYIVRLGFHDVAAPMQTVFPGRTFTWQVGGAQGSAISSVQIRDSIRFTADLDLTSNTATVRKYGTNRLAN